MDSTFQGERYRLREEIGSGANAIVWHAEDRQTGADVAIKILRSMDSDDAIRLAQEFRILQRLEHENIVRIFDYGVVAEGFPYVVIERIQGMDLRLRLHQQRALPLAEVLAIVEQICAALVEAHKAGVVHRDIKPENVLLCAPDHRVVKIVDFGTAKLLGSDAPVITLDGRILGTPEYMAPERAHGRPVGGAADVYAVAIMAYEMVAGRIPFEGRTPIETIAQQIRNSPPPMEGVALEVQEAISWGLVKDPTLRPSAEDFAARLARVR